MSAEVAFWQHLRAWRKRLGLSQAQAASELDVSQATIFSWEAGRRQPASERVVRFALEAIERRIMAERRLVEEYRAEEAARAGG